MGALVDGCSPDAGGAGAESEHYFCPLQTRAVGSNLSQSLQTIPHTIDRPDRLLLAACIQQLAAQVFIYIAQYEKSIQSAFSEVADALTVRANICEQLDAQRALVADHTAAQRRGEPGESVQGAGRLVPPIALLGEAGGAPNMA